MMETIKRHAFLIGLGAGVVVISLIVIVLVYFLYLGPNAEMRRQWRSTNSQANTLKSGPVFTDKLVAEMAKQVESRKKQHDELLDYIRTMGASRKPLVDGLFPVSTDVDKRHAFKAEYDAAIGGFMKELGAVTPLVDTRGVKPTEADRAAAMADFLKATMFADPKTSFSRPDWVGRQDVPSLDLAREGQEDIWLMEDLVGIIAAMNQEILKSKNLEPVIANAPVKELVEMKIGGAAAVLEGTKMTSTPGRYRPAGVTATGKKETARPATLSGRVSKPGFYQILPWRVVVVVESQYGGELIRRFKGRETFLSVEAWRVSPVTEATLPRLRSLMADSRENYGQAGVALLAMVGESLVFEIPGGRVTTVAKAAPPPEEKASEEQ